MLILASVTCIVFILTIQLVLIHGVVLGMGIREFTLKKSIYFKCHKYSNHQIGNKWI